MRKHGELSPTSDREDERKSPSSSPTTTDLEAYKTKVLKKARSNQKKKSKDSHNPEHTQLVLKFPPSLENQTNLNFNIKSNEF